MGTTDSFVHEWEVTRGTGGRAREVAKGMEENIVNGGDEEVDERALDFPEVSMPGLCCASLENRHIEGHSY